MTIPSYCPGETTAADAERLTTIHDLARVLGIHATQDALSRFVYDQTACGAWIALVRAETAYRVTGIRLGSNVEGVDEAPAERLLALPFTLAEFRGALTEIEDEVTAIWRRTHGCLECGPGDPETGLRSVREGCPACGGHGRVL